MALITFEMYSGKEIDLNADDVQSVSTYDAFDHDMQLPEDFYAPNGDGYPELRHDKLDEANAMRTAPRVLLLMRNGASFEVKGSLAQVRKALSGKK